jgi:hypothetical protein
VKNFFEAKSLALYPVNSDKPHVATNPAVPLDVSFALPKSISALNSVEAFDDGADSTSPWPHKQP